MRNLWPPIQAFLCTRISASGFGLMRIGWALTVLYLMMPQWHEINILHLLLLASSFCMLLGKWPRVATIISVLLFSFFLGKTDMSLRSGDTVLHLTGFLLIITPELRAFSVMRLRQQWHCWKEKRSLLPPLTMSIWPYRLLLLQLIVLYVMSAWITLTGDTEFRNAPLIIYAILVWQFSWALLLIPRPLLPTFTQFPLKRVILFLGVLFHGSIFLLMEVGAFSYAILASYLGLLLAEDFDALRSWFNRKWHGKIAILYDGNCGLCQHSIFTLLMLDSLERLQLVNYHDAATREKVAPDLKFEDLDRVIHMRFPDGSTKTGFYAFRSICWHLPTLWLLAPLLYLPGVPPVGRRVYAWTAERRKRCTHEQCRF